MKTEKFKRGVEIHEEFKHLKDLENSLKSHDVQITVKFFDKWKNVKDAFDRKAWQDNLKDLIMAGIEKRKKELEKEFEEL
jgi:hypothetical protein